MTSVEDGEVGSAEQSPAVKVEHFSVAEREARGKAARAEVPRKVHAEWEPTSVRPDPVELLEEQAQTRVPELVPIRYGRMLVSPFTFYRGAAYLMASDLAGMPRTGLHTQLCGDAHLSNFGMFAAPDRRLVFSVNDFDETLPGPFEWDVKRLVASFAVAGRDRGFDKKMRETINRTVGQAYREGIRRFAAMGNLALWYARVNVDEVAQEWLKQATAKQAKRYDAGIAKVRSKDSLKAFAKLTEIVDGEPRIISDPPVVVPIEDLAWAERAHEFEDFLRGVIRSYRRTLPGDRRKLLERYRYVHAARKVVGVGSVGTRAFIMLMLGRDGDDPLFLQFKEAEASVLESFLSARLADTPTHVVNGCSWYIRASFEARLGSPRTHDQKEALMRLHRNAKLGLAGRSRSCRRASWGCRCGKWRVASACRRRRSAAGIGAGGELARRSARRSPACSTARAGPGTCRGCCPLARSVRSAPPERAPAGARGS